MGAPEFVPHLGRILSANFKPWKSISTTREYISSKGGENPIAILFFEGGGVDQTPQVWPYKHNERTHESSAGKVWNHQLVILDLWWGHTPRHTHFRPSSWGYSLRNSKSWLQLPRNESDGSEPNKFKKQLHLWPKVLEGFCRWPLVGGFNQPLWKICSNQNGNQSSPNHFRGENKDKIELPPSRWGWLSHVIYQKNKNRYFYISKTHRKLPFPVTHLGGMPFNVTRAAALSSDAHFSRRSSFFLFVFRFGSFKNQDMLGCPRKLGSMVSNQVGYKLYLQMGYSLGL